MSAIATFFGVLFALLFAVAVTSRGALKGPDAFALRWTVISLAVAAVESRRGCAGEQLVAWPSRIETRLCRRATDVLDDGSREEFTCDDGMLRRPFANYPHDWRAIQICSGLLAERLRDTHGLHGTGAALRDRSDAERDALGSDQG